MSYRGLRFCSQCHRCLTSGNDASLLHFSTHVTSTITMLLRYALLSSWYRCKKSMLLPCVWFCVRFFGIHLVHNFRNRSFAMISCIIDLYCTFPQRYHDEGNNVSLNVSMMTHELKTNKLAPFPEGELQWNWITKTDITL